MNEKHVWQSIKESGLSCTEKFELQVKAAVFFFCEQLKKENREPDIKWLSDQFLAKGISLVNIS